MAVERLQKILARAGVASRRAAEELIRQGRVRVDGRVVTELGTRADARRARVEVDGRRISPEPFVYVILHKPKNVVSTLRDPEGRKTVLDCVRGLPVRVVPVGRLDYHTSGVLLLTNDGDFSSALLHPRSGCKKTYVAKVSGEVTDEGLERWSQRLLIDGRATQPAEVRRLRFESGKTWLELTLREGKNRQIHRLGEAAGFPVMRLARIRFADITAEGLRPGQWRHLSVDELKQLKRTHGVPRRVRPPMSHSVHGAPRRTSEGGGPPPGRGTAGRNARPLRPRATVRTQPQRKAEPSARGPSGGRRPRTAKARGGTSRS